MEMIATTNRELQMQHHNKLVSAKTLADVLDVKIRTVREWVTRARNHPTPNDIPFIQMPGSRLIRFDLNEVRDWYARGKSKHLAY